MKRFMVATITVVFVFVTGVVYAQEDGPPPVPEKVKKMLERFVGTWTSVSGEGGWLKLTTEFRWDPARDYVVSEIYGTIEGVPIFSTELCGWDGVSEDGIVFFRVARDNHQSGHAKIVSDTVMEGEATGVYNGEKLTGTIRYVFQSPDRFTYVAEDSKDKSKPNWTAVYTRVKTDAPKPSPEMKKLEGLIGDWTYKGEQAAPPIDGLPYGGAGEYSGTFSNRFVLGGFFMETKFEEINPAGKMTAVEMTWYGAKAKAYTSNLYLSEGDTSVATATLDRRVWTASSTMTTTEGKKVLLRSIVRYASDWNSYAATVELSPDDGKTWKFWFKDEGGKIKK